MPIVTLKLHEAWRVNASVAVQVTIDDPTGNVAPDSAVHVTGMGDWPPTATGGVNATATPRPSSDDAVIEVGHESVGAAGVGCGVVGGDDEPQAASVVRLSVNSVNRSLRTEGYRCCAAPAADVGVLSNAARIAA